MLSSTFTVNIGNVFKSANSLFNRFSLFPCINVVDSGELDANYFQHLPYLEDFNQENGTHIVSVSAIHVEPLGIYGGKQTSLDPLK